LCSICLVKHIIKGNIDGGIEVTGKEKGDVTSYRMTFRKGENTINS
jgi:hypothetical protein